MANKLPVNTLSSTMIEDPNKDHTELDSIYTSLERILQWARAKLGEGEFVKAKEDFFWKMGKVFYDDDFYHRRMTLFTDHFLFERSIESDKRASHMTPYELWSETFPKKKVVKGFRHSIFKILKSRDNTLSVCDILDGSKIILHGETEKSFLGMDRNMLIQGFIFHLQTGIYLSEGTIFHPKSSLTNIKRSIKFSQKNRTFEENRFLATTAKIQLKNIRHNNIASNHIYTLEALI